MPMAPAKQTDRARPSTPLPWASSRGIEIRRVAPPRRRNSCRESHDLLPPDWLFGREKKHSTRAPRAEEQGPRCRPDVPSSRGSSSSMFLRPVPECSHRHWRRSSLEAKRDNSKPDSLRPIPDPGRSRDRSESWRLRPVRSNPKKALDSAPLAFTPASLRRPSDRRGRAASNRFRGFARFLL